jgi:hypothetical protein
MLRALATRLQVLVEQLVAIAYAMSVIDEARADPTRIASALRQIARGFDELADAVVTTDEGSQDDRFRRLVEEWAERGLTRDGVSAMFRSHGFAPQAAGGWARAGWLETRDDGRRYMTERSLELLRDDPE